LKVWVSGIRVEGLMLGDCDLGFRVWFSDFRISFSGYRAQGSRLKVEG
jgi:hypothetical protein